MAIAGPLYTRSFNPVWFFVDLAGLPCDDTFYLYVLQNMIPYLPAPVYHTPTGTPWVNPIQLLANGTLPLDVYWDPERTYRLELRHNIGPLPPSQADPLIYLIENYVPPETGANPVNTNADFTGNQVSNPQFADINFSSPYNLTGVINPPSIEIAPGWFIDLTGNGTLLVEQIPLNNALANPTNAPYALRINLSGGWTGLPILRQRFQQNGMLWANKHVSVSFTARITGAAQAITARLDASNGAVLQVLTTAVLTNAFVEYTGNALLPATTNPNLPPDSWIDFKLLLPPVSDIYITSLQLIVSDQAVNVGYEQETVDRQLDHLFHYYNSKLQFKPISSYLAGWDFALNPAQFNGDAVAVQAVGANSSYYAWDQTILFQSANSGLTVVRGLHGGLNVTAAQNGQFAVIQYLDQAQARKILQEGISVYLKCMGNVAAGNVIGSVSLWYTKDMNLPDVDAGSNDTFIATLDAANGRPTTFTLGFNWIEVLRNNLQNAIFTLDTGDVANFPFNGWNIANDDPADANLATFFAIVIGFGPLIIADSIELISVGLVSGDIPTIPAPQTPQEAQIDCNRYYYKTFNPGVVPAQNVGVNSAEYRYAATQIDGGNSYSTSIIFPAPMRAIPEITFFNPAAANALARNLTQANNAVATNTTDCGLSRVSFNIHSQGQAGWTVGDRLAIHFTADARLGIVN